MSFEMEWSQQKVTRDYDYARLTNLMIEEVATTKHLTTEGFNALLEIIVHRNFQESKDMYYFVTALRDDGIFLSAHQLAELFSAMHNEEYIYLSEENAYGLFDVIVDLFDSKDTRKILEHFQNRIHLKDAAIHATARIER